MAAEVLRDLGRRVRATRLLYGMSQRDLAAVVPTTAASISRVERGTEAPALWIALALLDWLDEVDRVTRADATPDDPASRSA